jgi:outer membrane autotransporter protein
MALPNVASSADWIGGTGDWDDPWNWNTFIVPDSATPVNVNGGLVTIRFGAPAFSSNTIIDLGGEVDAHFGNWENDGNSPGLNQRGGAIIVGDVGSGTLIISNGGAVKTTGNLAGSVLIGNQVGSNGTVTVGGGAGTSNLENAAPVGHSGNFYVGYAGTGTLNVNAGGTVTGFYDMKLGIDPTGSGTLNVDGGTIDLPTSVLTVGDQGQGRLTVKNGGTVSTSAGFVTGNGSTATVTGTGSAWNLGTGGLRVGTAGSGTLTIDDHATVDVTAGSAQFYLAQGPGSGSMTVENGGTIKTNGAFIGQTTAGPTQVSITGPGSIWNAAASNSYFWTFSGAAGTTIDVTAGGNLTTYSAVIGDLGTADTSVTVDGSSSVWNNTNSIYLGYHSTLTSSTGTLNLVDGGTVSTSKLAIYVDGKLNLGTGGLAGDFIGSSIVNNGLIAADFTDTSTLDAAISGSGTLTKKGIGTLTLNGVNTYTGLTTVDGGKLVVGDDSHAMASLLGGVFVNNSGTLGGIGTIGNMTIGSGGTLAPGNSIGTINVAGNVAFGPGSVYAVEVDAAGHSDKTVATGTATLNGGTVKVLAGAGSYAPQTDYTILTASGGRTGTFAGVNSNLAFLKPSLAYDANNAYLTMKRNDASFSGIGQTFNQKAAGGGTESMGAGSPIYNAIAGLSADQARAAFDGLSGEIHASAKTALMGGSHFLRDAVNERIRSAFGGVGAAASPVLAYGATGTDNGATGAIGHALAPADTANLAAWGSVFGSWGSTDGNGNAAGLDRSTGGFFTGIDGLVAEDIRLGITTGYSHTTFDVDGRASSGESDNYHLGIYGGTEVSNLGLRAGAAYTWHDISTRRSVAFPGFADSLTADYNAGTFQAFGEAGYRIDAATASFEPFANLAYVSLHTDGFTEKGGSSALTSNGQTIDTTFTTLGIRASTAFDLGGTKATARGMIGWRHAFGDTTPLATQAFSFAAGSPFTVAGVPIAKDTAVLEAGLDFVLSDNATLGVSYTGQFGSDARDNGAKADLSVKF